MEILSVLAPTATPAPPKVLDGSMGEEFTAFLENAQGALGTDASPPIEGTLPVGEVAETEPIAPPQLLDPALAAALTLVTNPFVASMPASLPNASVSPVTEKPLIGTAANLANAVPATAIPAKTTGLPEAPVPTEIAVEVFDIEPFEPPVAEPVVEEVPADLLEKGSVETASSDGEEAPEPDSSEPDAETARLEGKAEARTEAPSRTEATTKAEAVRPALRLDTYNVVRELANRIELMAAAKDPQGVIIHLQPADLGSITLLVKPDSGGGVTAQMGASNDQVRQALEGSQGALTKQLELRGHVVASVSVSAETAQRDPQRQSQQQQQAFQPRQFHQQASSRSPQYGSSDPVARPTRLKATGVDLWI